MSRSTTRAAIIILTLITAAVHLIVLNFQMGQLDLLFTLNGLGYLGLLGLYLIRPAFLATQNTLLYGVYILFTIATIVAFFIFGSMSDMLGWATKVVEVLLILALVMEMRARDEV